MGPPAGGGPAGGGGGGRGGLGGALGRARGCVGAQAAAGLPGGARAALEALPGGAPGALEALALELLLRAPLAAPLALAAALRAHLGALAPAAVARAAEFGAGRVCRRLLLWLRLQPAALVPVLTACQALPGPFAGLECDEDTLEAVVTLRFAADSASAGAFRRAWDLSPLHKLLGHRVADVRWHAAQLLGWVLEMGLEGTRCLVAGAVSEHEAAMSAARWAQLCGNIARELSAACGSIPAGEAARGAAGEDPEALCDQLLRGPTLGEGRCNGAGASSSGAATELFVFTSSVCRASRLASIAVAAGHPVLLCGPAGCGKSALVRHLVGRSGNALSAVHMDDSSDMRFLLGSYVCGEQPGSFEWRDGPLTHAVRTGQWLLLEDIDAAPADVLSAVGAVVASGRLDLPSQGGEVCAAPGFRVVATLSTPQELSQSTYLSKMQESAKAAWTIVLMPEPTAEEIVALMGAKFPDIRPLLPLALHMIWSIRKLTGKDSLSTGEEGSALGEHDGIGEADPPAVRRTARLVLRARPVTLRDLHKWCVRMTTLRGGAWAGQALKGRKIDGPGDVCKLPENFRRACFQEAFDLFAVGLSNDSDKEMLLLHLVRLWGLPDDNVHYFLNLHSPHVLFSANSRECEIGRSVLQKHHMAAYEEQRDSLPASSEYTLTGSSTRLLERVAVAVQVEEPVLLVGETGVGKTSAVQALSKDLGAPLRVVNLSHQTDSADLLGGFKPVEPKSRVHDLIKKVTPLVHSTWPNGDNTKFVKSLLRHCHDKKYRKVLKAVKSANSRVEKSREFLKFSTEGAASSEEMEDLPELGGHVQELLPGWAQAMAETQALELLLSSDSAFCFAYVPGALAEAITEGHWVLLDEINLAPHETLQRLSGLLDSPAGSVTLTERGDLEPLRRHPRFRVFAAMNPATDTGKSDLPPALRGRFTEIYVSDELPREDLERIVSSALAEVAPDPPVAGVVDFYTEVRRLAATVLEDGAGQRPCYSLRSLSRLLRYARKMAPMYGLSRALFDGALVSFATQLSVDSRKAVSELAKKILPGQHTSRIIAPGLAPGRKAVEFEGFWIDTGNFEEQKKTPDGRFVMTPTVRTRLQDVARAVSYNSSPILLQGPTSAGKTSLVAHLASEAGYRCIRINNHEHTDIQEYMGSYASGEDGRICFKEGLLVQALRRGFWVVLDELNLAPTEVLEALNRLLDDNQELYVPELNETVRPAPGFMLFATQNPPGPYSGRKALSRALRNRFIELQIDDLPPEEVTSMLEARCEIPKSYATKMVQVMRDLQRVRSASAVFVGKGGLVTPRDLFRWAARGGSGYQHLAEDGFLLLGERLRTDGERATVREILERAMKVQLGMTSVYDLDAGKAQGRIKQLRESPGTADISALTAIVWGPTMRYLYTVTARSVLHREPVLLIGETGCGKTTVCQTISMIRQQKLHIVNCHQHSEASDFLGGFRPSRHRGKGRQMAVAAAGVLTALPEFCGKASAALVELFAKIAKIAAAESHSVTDEDAKNFRQAVKMVRKELPQFVDGAGPEAMETENGSPQDSSGNEVRTQFEIFQKGCQLFASPFEWSDGPLVQAMQNGDAILIDEINLAADAVIERLNSVLEPERTLTLSERGGSDDCEIVAHPEFRLFATMNPGLDFGKRELSPALRSRFTECWIPSALEDPEELRSLVDGRLDPSIEKDDQRLVGDAVLAFWLAFRKTVAATTGGASLATSFSGFSFSVRDILSWVHFVNDSLARQLCGAKEAIAHGAYLTVIDTIGVGSSSEKVQHLRGVCAAELAAILQWSVPHLEEVAGCSSECPRYISENLWGIPPFALKIQGESPDADGRAGEFQVEAPTVRKNVLRILRALHLHRAIMLEGSPGVGKSSIVSALAKKAGKRLVRINFSEQTDMADLVGNDLPSESGGFAWNDGPLLTAIKQGSWVLLDELNLASQSVLEGLNSLLDHREEIFIPELGRKFPCSPGFQVFAAQNPLSQGGGRKGLPRSFMNRFTRVQVEALSVDDLHAIMKNTMSPADIAVPEPLLRGMVAFVSDLRELTGPFGSLARKGAPWDFNLRDLMRWYSFFQDGLSLSAAAATAAWCQAAASHAYSLAFRERLRTEEDKEALDILFTKHMLFRPSPVGVWLPTSGGGRVHGIVPRAESLGTASNHPWHMGHHVAREHLSAFEATLYSAKMGWPTLLVGPSAALRNSLVQATATACGVPGCVNISCGPNMDASDLLGGFEQEAHARRRAVAAQQLHVAAQDCTRTFLLRGSTYTEMSQAWEYARQACEKAEISQSQKIGQSEKKRVLLEALNKVRAALGVGGRAAAAEDAVHCAESILCSEKDAVIRWQDGPLLRALKDGLWLVLENANLCSPSVLDRLNPLLEPGGRLLVNEAGGGEDLNGNAQNHIIEPHKNFRIFLSYDSFLGEISRAMRNRCLEVHVSSPAAHANDIAAMGEPHGFGTPTPDEVRMLASAYSSHRTDSYEGARRMCSAYARSLDVLLAAGLPLGRGSALALEYSAAISDPATNPEDVPRASLAGSSGAGRHDTFEAGLRGLAHTLTGLLSTDMGLVALPESCPSASAVAASSETGLVPLERLYGANHYAVAVEQNLSDDKMHKFSLDYILAGAGVQFSLQKNFVVLAIGALSKELFAKISKTASAGWMTFFDAFSSFLFSTCAGTSCMTALLPAQEDGFLLLLALERSLALGDANEEELKYHTVRLLKSLEGLALERGFPHHALQEVGAAAFSAAGVLMGDGSHEDRTSRSPMGAMPYQSMETLRVAITAAEIRRAIHACSGVESLSQSAAACTVEFNQTLSAAEHFLDLVRGGQDAADSGRLRGSCEILDLVPILIRKILAKVLNSTEARHLGAEACSDPWNVPAPSGARGPCFLTAFPDRTSLPVQKALSFADAVAGSMDYELMCRALCDAYVSWTSSATGIPPTSAFRACFQVFTSCISSAVVGRQMLNLSGVACEAHIPWHPGHELYASIVDQRRYLDKLSPFKNVSVMLSETFCSASVLDRTVVITRQNCVADGIISRLPPFFQRCSSPEDGHTLMLAAEFVRLVGAGCGALSAEASPAAQALLELLLHRASNRESFAHTPPCCDTVARGKGALFTSTEPGFKQLLPEVVLPCIDSLLAVGDPRVPDTRAGTGRIFVYLGFLRLHLGAPRSQYDPAMIGTYESAAQESKKMCIAVPQIYYLQKLVALARHPSMFSQTLLNEMETYISRNQVPRAGTEGHSKAPLRPHPSQYQAIFESSQSALKELFLVSRMDALFQSLGSEDGEAWDQAAHFKETAGSWARSLKEQFWMYPDIVNPLVLGGEEIVHGLHSVLESRADATGIGGSVARSARMLMSFPNTFPNGAVADSCMWMGSSHEKALERLNGELVTSRMGSESDEAFAYGAAEFAVAAIERTSAATKVSAWMMPEHVRQAHGAFRFLVSRWEGLKSSEEDAAREAERAYSTKVYDSNESIISEDELDSWFVHPTPEEYEADVAGMETEGVKSKVRLAHAQELIPSSAKLEEVFCRRIAALHESLFGIFSPECDSSGHSYAHDLPLWHRLGRDMAQASRIDRRSSEGLESRVGYAICCQHESQLLVGKTLPSSKVDVREPAVREMALLLEPTKVLRSKVAAKLEELDSHPLLSRLLQSCEYILQMGVLVPLRKAISALELLLDRAKVWQDSALGVSGFHEELRELQRLADSWRRLEITAWENALDFTAEAHVFQAIKGWFHIYSVLRFRPGCVPRQSELIQVARCVEEFMTSSTVGQYKTRLRLVRAFLDQVQAERLQERSQTKKKTLKRLAAMLFNLHVHYDALSEKVQGVEKTERAALEKELRLVAAKARRDKPESLAGLGDAKIERLGGALLVARGQLRSVIRRYDVALSMPANVPLKEGMVPAYSSKQIKDVDPYFGEDLVLTRTDTAATASHLHKISPGPLAEAGGRESSMLARQGLRSTADRLVAILSGSEDSFVPREDAIDLFGAAEAVDEALRTLLEEVDLSSPKKDGGEEEDEQEGEEDKKEREAQERAAKRSQIMQKRRGQFADILRMLRRFGLPRRLLGDSVSEAWLFSPLPTEGDAFMSQQAPSSAAPLWPGVNATFHTATALAQHLPGLAKQPHEDVIPRDSEAGAAAVSHLQTLQRTQRRAFEAACTQNSILRDLERLISSLVEAPRDGGVARVRSLPPQTTARRWLWALKATLDRALDAVLQVQSFLDSAPAESESPPTKAHPAAAAVSTALEHLKLLHAALQGVLFPRGGRPERAMAFVSPDGDGVRDMCPAVITWDAVQSVRAAVGRAGAARGALLVRVGEKHRDVDVAAHALRSLQEMQALAHEAATELSIPSASGPGGRKRDFSRDTTQQVRACIEAILLWAQESRIPAPAAGTAPQPHSSPLSDGTQRLTASLAIDRCTPVCKTAGALVRALVQTLENGGDLSDVAGAARSALGFLSLMRSVHAERLHFAARFHRRVCHFTHATAAYMASLCTGGFRVPPAETGEDVWNVGDGGGMHGSGAQLDGDVRDAPQQDGDDEPDPQDLRDLPMDDLPPDSAQPPEAAPGGVQTEQDLDGPAEDLPQDLGEFDLGDGIPEDDGSKAPEAGGEEEEKPPQERPDGAGEEEGDAGDEQDALDEELWGLDGEEAPGQVDHDPRLPQARGAEPPPEDGDDGADEDKPEAKEEGEAPQEAPDAMEGAEGEGAQDGQAEGHMPAADDGAAAEAPEVERERGAAEEAGPPGAEELPGELAAAEDGGDGTEEEAATADGAEKGVHPTEADARDAEADGEATEAEVLPDDMNMDEGEDGEAEEGGEQAEATGEGGDTAEEAGVTREGEIKVEAEAEEESAGGDRPDGGEEPGAEEAPEDPFSRRPLGQCAAVAQALETEPLAEQKRRPEGQDESEDMEGAAAAVAAEGGESEAAGAGGEEEDGAAEHGAPEAGGGGGPGAGQEEMIEGDEDEDAKGAWEKQAGPEDEPEEAGQAPREGQGPAGGQEERGGGGKGAGGGGGDEEAPQTGEEEKASGEEDEGGELDAPMEEDDGGGGGGRGEKARRAAEAADAETEDADPAGGALPDFADRRLQLEPPQEDEAEEEEEEEPEADDAGGDTEMAGEGEGGLEDAGALGRAVVDADDPEAEGPPLPPGEDELDGGGSAAVVASGPREPLAPGAARWSAAVARTEGLVSELVQALRLLLQPTEHTRLGGEYRTGKRINMRRVIPYIASGFRKDKIWMRRTKPSNRKYQVLLCVDDSRSMRENRCEEAALDALALLCRAMAQVEVGEVGVLGFGGEAGVRELHPLGGYPVGDDAGARVVDALQFSQDGGVGNRPLARLLRFLGDLLDRTPPASASRDASQLSQLVLVIADGRIHERDEVRALVRELAARSNLLVAFLALDNPTNSLAGMQSVQFEAGQPVFKLYLDSFPFHFYLLLQDSRALPETLGGLLRQWFELAAMRDQ